MFHPPVEATRIGSFGNNMGKWSQAILSQEGDVYGVPWSADKVLKIRPVTDQADGMGTLAIDTVVTARDLEHIAARAHVKVWVFMVFSWFSSIMYHHGSSHSRGRSNERSSRKVYGCSRLGTPVFSPHRPMAGGMLAKVALRRFGRHKSSIRILMANGSIVVVPSGRKARFMRLVDETHPVLGFLIARN